MRTPRPLIDRLTLVAVSAALMVTTTPNAHADPVPYSDASAQGSVGLCDRTGQPITHGKIHDKPFVARAVSSYQPPAQYQRPGRKATLFAFQPRRNTPADQWSGDLLTAASAYSNPASPMAQATPDDFALADFLAEFPPQVDGLIQLRMYFGIPGATTFTSAYPTTDIRISGETWTVVRGDSGSCMNGTATSSEVAYLKRANPLAPAPSTSGQATSSAAGGSLSSHASGSATPAAGSATSATANETSASVSAADAAARKQHTALWPAALVVGGLAGVGALVWFWRRRMAGLAS